MKPRSYASFFRVSNASSLSPSMPLQLDLQILRAGVEAAAAAHALAERIHLLLRFLRNPRAGALVVIAVGRNPGL